MIGLSNLIHQCAPTVAPDVVEAIIRTESSFDPLALHVNGKVRLRVQPLTAAQAARWADWLIARGYSVDMGLMQINSRNLAPFNLTPLDAFDPCRNIRTGAAILTAGYGRAARIDGSGSRALLRALSAYNTGTFTGGFHNGYVQRVVANASHARAPAALDLTCLLTRCSTRPVTLSNASPYTADSAVRGFVGSRP